MRNKVNNKEVITSALLISLGIIIPLFSPLKIILEPASFTLGSHIAIFIAMFISPTSAVLVSFGTTIGFFIGGFPLMVVIRALSHIIFAFIGSNYICRNRIKFNNLKSTTIFSLIIGIIHGLCEVIAIMPFYINQSLSMDYYNQGFIRSIILLVGGGTVIHSMIDYALSVYVWHLIPNKLTDNIQNNTTKVNKI